MHAIKTPSFLRPASRPSSPAPQQTGPPSRPDSGIGMERARPLQRLGLTTFRKASPASGPPPTSGTPTPLPQDGSYLELLSLKLSEAVSKALAQPNGPPTATEQVSGRRPIPNGRGHALGSLIAAELRAANGSAHLYRAILRSLHRPLSVLLGNLSSLLLPLLSSPQLHVLPSTAPQGAVLNPTQLHAASIATLAGELLETFDEFGLGLDGDVRGDGLRHIREGLHSVVTRVVNPFFALIKNELLPLLEALETPSSKSAKGVNALHPSIVTLQTVMPAYSRALARYTSTPAAQNALASIVISLIWKALVALSSRPYTGGTPPGSPGPGGLKKRRSSPTASPPMTPPASRFAIKLPSSRPPSPTMTATSTSSADARALYDLFNLLPRPDAAKPTTQLAREAVDEAYDDIAAMPKFFDDVYSSSALHNVYQTVAKLNLSAADIPTLIALPIVMHIHGNGELVSSLLGLEEDKYRAGCLTSFSRAEECADAVGQGLLSKFDISPGRESVLYRWLEAELEEDS